MLSWLVSAVSLSLISLWFAAQLSICFLSPWRPRCRPAKTKWDGDDGITVTRHSVVKQACGRVVRAYVDPAGPDDVQHVIIVWGVLRLMPVRVLQLVIYQAKFWSQIGPPVTFYKSWSPFPVTNAHLIGFDLVDEGDEIDLQGAQIIEMSDEDGHKIMTGARDLRTWSHKKCPWLLPAESEDGGEQTVVA